MGIMTDYDSIFTSTIMCDTFKCYHTSVLKDRHYNNYIQSWAKNLPKELSMVTENTRLQSALKLTNYLPTKGIFYIRAALTITTLNKYHN